MTDCKYGFEREVNEVLWYTVFPETFGDNNFENDTFKIKPYSWNDDDENDCHFCHKSSGFKLCWYKYPLRSPMANMEITHEQFLAILRDCHNSLKKGFYYGIEPWWESENESEVAE